MMMMLSHTVARHHLASVSRPLLPSPPPPPLLGTTAPHSRAGSSSIPFSAALTQRHLRRMSGFAQRMGYGQMPLLPS